MRPGWTSLGHPDGPAGPARSAQTGAGGRARGEVPGRRRRRDLSERWARDRARKAKGSGSTGSAVGGPEGRENAGAPGAGAGGPWTGAWKDQGEGLVQVGIREGGPAGRWERDRAHSVSSSPPPARVSGRRSSPTLGAASRPSATSTRAGACRGGGACTGRGSTDVGADGAAGRGAGGQPGCSAAVGGVAGAGRGGPRAAASAGRGAASP